ncbi:hypothetical protein [Thermocladium modestius]|nr:hypothetical protein [Thermocladium modestius]
MSVLQFEADDLNVRCDMNYGNYSMNGLNYVPCEYRGRGVGRAVPYLLRYLGLREEDEGKMSESRFGRVMVKSNGDDEVTLWVSVDVMRRGYSTGEVVRQVAYVTRGILLCLG